MTDTAEVVIVGGGPAGITSAYKLSENGIHTILLEKDPEIGGLSKTVYHNGCYIDPGGHRFFTDNQEVKQLWRTLLAADMLQVQRNSSIYFKGNFLDYPLNAYNALASLGTGDILTTITSYFDSRMFPTNPVITFEHHMSNMFGKKLYETFFKEYTEKVMGLPCSEISADWAIDRIQDFSLGAVLKHASGIKKNNNSKTRTQVEAFYYPIHGPGTLWAKMAEQIKNRKSHIINTAEVVKIHLDNKGIDFLEVNIEGKQTEIKGRQLISTMPLRELIMRLQPLPEKEVISAAYNLKYRDFLTVALIIRKKVVFSQQWIYVNEKAVKVCRIQNYKNWSVAMVDDQDKTCIGMEYFCFKNDVIWSLPDNELIKLAVTEITFLFNINPADIEDSTVIRMPNAYPIYDLKYKDNVVIIMNYLSNLRNLHTIGRNGLHKYVNMDYAMDMALMLCDKIMK
ncbi:MAG: FAD-dependent oxidoreductase [Nitrospirota bacterium]